MKRKVSAALMSLCLLLTMLSPMAWALGPGESVPVSTPEDLMAVLSSTAADATAGVTYVLDCDLTIDTSALSTSFSSGNPARTFRGILDGNGHTITVSDAGDAPSQPLFDFLQGSSGQSAGVKNLTLVFEGNVAGTTVAGCLTYATLEQVDILFQKDIVFARSGEYAIATGIFGFPSTGSPISLQNVSVTATGASPYGVIGSDAPQDSRYVMAAGVYSECNVASIQLICDGIQVSVESIRALSQYTPDTSGTYAACCAAGVASGYSQTNLRLGNAAVSVSDQIYAEAVEGSSADADAFGLGFHLLAMYHCSVTVGGNIEAKGNASGYTSSSKYRDDGTVCASGMGYVVQTKYNDATFGANDSGECSVQVGGDILATVTGASTSPDSAAACGIAVYTSQENTWRNVSVTANRIHSEASGPCSASASGFAYNAIYSANNTGDAFDFEHCSVTAEEISCRSDSDGGYTAGFMFWGYGTYGDCSVDVTTLDSFGAEAATAGFTYDFSPNTSSYRGDKHGEMDGCQVSAASITATNTDATYAAEVSGLIGAASLAVKGITATVRNCSVQLTDTLAASGYNCVEGLLIETNDHSYEVYDNTVTLPLDQADLVALDGVNYVGFTVMEVDGRAGGTPEETSFWESGNQVNLIGHSENQIFCRYDQGDTEIGTLWQLVPTLSYYTLTYESNGGTQYDSETYSGGTTVSLDKVPAREGYDFTGWFSDQALTTPVTQVVMDASKTVYAGWSPVVQEYTLTYESNGGTQYDSETYSDGTTVSLDKVPAREGYDFTGWFADQALTTPVTQVVMDTSKTVYAGWSPVVQEYTLTYESNGGTQYDSESYSGGTTVTLDKVPTREGYTFLGWYDTPALTSPVTQIVMDGDKIVFAGWSANSTENQPSGGGQGSHGQGSQGGQTGQSGTSAQSPQTDDGALPWVGVMALAASLGGLVVIIRRPRGQRRS